MRIYFFGTKDAEAVKQVLESVVETRKELRSVADGMTFGPLIFSEWCLIIRRVRVNRATGRLDSPPRRTTTHLVGECVRAGEYVLRRCCLTGIQGSVGSLHVIDVDTLQVRPYNASICVRCYEFRGVRREFAGDVPKWASPE